MLSQIGELLIQTAFGVFVYALLLRFYMQWLRAPFRNPVGQFVSALTDWIVKPVRRVVPGLLGLDLATMLIAWFAEALMQVLISWLRGFSFVGAPGIAAGLLFTVAAVELLRASLYLLIGVIIVQVVITWVNPRAPLAPVFDADGHVKITPEFLKSQGKNTPFIGYELPGRVRYTMVSGKVVYEA